ncbi:MAG: acyltransferase [Streptococcaceae bacterium]|jgi:acetyltransferase-like isoleucine patch superfamily enzyme|nr:acyltransferase [Streptococcaceae bacterium]
MFIIYKIKLFIFLWKRGLKSKYVHIGPRFDISSSINFEGVTYIGPDAKINGKGKVNFGDNTIVGPGLKIMTSVHNYETNLLPYDGKNDISGDVQICENVWIGMDVIIMPNIKIGEGSIIGARSFINKDVPAFSIMGGTPAKVLKYRDKADYSTKVKEKRLYLHEKYGIK